MWAGLLPRQEEARRPASKADALPTDISLLVGPDFSLRCVHPGKSCAATCGRGWEHATSAGTHAMRDCQLYSMMTLKPPCSSPEQAPLHQPPALQLLAAHTASPEASLHLSTLPPGDGWEQWQQQFEAPPVSAYAAGGRVDLLGPTQQQRAAMGPAPGTAAPGYGALLPASGSGGGSSKQVGSEAVVLVAQNDSLFAIPAARLTFEAPGGGGATVAGAVPAGEQCEVPVVDRLVRERETQGSATPGSALALIQQQQQQQQRAAAAAGGGATEQQCRPADSGTCAAATLGVYAVHQHSSSGLLLLPPSANGSAEAAAQQQSSSGKTLANLGWLVLLGGAGFGATASLVVLVFVAWQRAAAAQQLQEQQAAAVDMPNGIAIGAAAAGDAAGSGKARRRGSAGGKRQQQQMSNHMRGLVQQAAANDVPAQQPPTKQQQQQQPWQQQQQQPGKPHDDTLPSSAAVAAGLMDPTMRRREMQDGVMLVGRMRVGPGVLGYGSGGTVVFSGELDGRPVAVKRMLRQFYEMARKEIDALILADEHPNIVR